MKALAVGIEETLNKSFISRGGGGSSCVLGLASELYRPQPTATSISVKLTQARTQVREGKGAHFMRV